MVSFDTFEKDVEKKANLLKTLSKNVKMMVDQPELFFDDDWIQKLQTFSTSYFDRRQVTEFHQFVQWISTAMETYFQTKGICVNVRYNYYFTNRRAEQSFSFTLSQYDLAVATFLLDSRKLYFHVTSHRAKHKEALDHLESTKRNWERQLQEAINQPKRFFSRKHIVQSEVDRLEQNIRDANRRISEHQAELEFLRVHDHTFSQTESSLYKLNREIIRHKNGGKFYVDYVESLPKHS